MAITFSDSVDFKGMPGLVLVSGPVQDLIGEATEEVDSLFSGIFGDGVH